MKQEDLEFMEEILSRSYWLFYGEFEIYINKFLKDIFSKEFSDIGFDEALSNDFQVAYWSVISELDRLRLFEYGTSPRGGWLTEDGERFKKLIMENKNALTETQKYIYNQLH
jgi:hypothetical protein